MAHTDRIGTFRIATASVATAAALLLGACGGGGGDVSVSVSATAAAGSTTANASIASTSASKSGFVPAAPTIGETLHAEVALLRPLRDEALWVYQGVKHTAGGKLAYSSFRQTIASSGAFEERINSPLEGDSRVQGLQISGGVLTRRDDLGLPAGTLSASITELRSPVRRNDQVTLADVVGVQLKEDLDKDQKTDLIDLGAYSRVIGDEEVELPELGRTVRALRVDVMATARITMSSRSQPEPAMTVVESTWYAAGIGIVRRSSTAPSSHGIGAVASDERLQFWDGVATGAGLVPSAPVSKSGGLSSLGPWLELPLSATRNGGHAFVLSSRGGVPVRADRGVVLSVLDARGRVVSSVDHLDLDLPAQARPEIMALADGVAMVFTEPGVYSDPYLLENLRMVRFDAQGQRGSSHWLAAGALPGSLKAASDGKLVWVTWVEQGLRAGTSRVMAQAFDERGNERSPPQVLDSRSGFEPSSIGISAAGSRALVTWRAPQGQGVDFRQALVSLDRAPAVATLEAGAVTLGSASAQPVPRLSDSVALLTWYDPLQQAGAGTTGALPRGVALEMNATARRAVAGAADNETLPLPAHERQVSSMGLDAGRLLWSGAGTARVRSDDLVDDRFIDFAALEATSGPLSGASVQLRRYRDRSPAVNTDSRVGAVRHVLGFEDRYLIIGQDNTRLTVAVLYK